jgi:small-conductance mechanosensitive channel
MATLDKLFLSITVYHWLIAALVTVVTFIVLSILKKILAKKLGALAATTDTKLDDLVVALIRETKFLTILVTSLFAGSMALALPAKTDVIVQKALVLTLLIQGALWLNHVITYWFDQILDKKIQNGSSNATTRSVLNFVTKLALWTTTLLLVLDNLGFNITTLIAGVGVGGIAIALAVQNVLGDLFASLSIILDKPFVVGDFIIVDQYLGTVKQVGLKTTRIQSLSGEEVIFSNADLLKSRIRNYKRMYERRVVFTIGITYETPYEKLALVKSMLRQIIESQHDVRFDRAHFKEYGDSALIYESVYYVLDPDYNKYMDTQEAINTELFRRFEENGLDFAYPTRTVIVRQEQGPAAGKDATT